MGNIWKRLLSLALATVMVIGMMPVQAFAAEESAEAVPEVTESPTQASEPETDPAVEAVQAVINALPAAVSSAEEAEALNAALATVSDAIADLTTEQAQQLDLDRYHAAAAALEQWYAQDYSDNVLADLADCYWDGETLYIKDGNAIDLYTALLTHTGYTNVSTVKYGTNRNTVALRGTEVKSGSTYTIAAGAYYYYIRYNNYKTATEQFSVAYYHDLAATVGEGSPEGAAISLSANRVAAGEAVSITVADLAGYTATVTDAKGNVIHDLSAYVPTESTTLTVTYVSNEAEKYTVTLETIGVDYGTAVLKSDSSLIAGAEVLISAEARERTDGTFYYIKSVMAGDTALTVNENGYYTYTIGSSDVTITVTFEKYELSAHASDASGGYVQVKFNGYAEATVAQQLEAAHAYYAAVEEKTYLEQTILNALGVTLNDSVPGTEDVQIRYVPWYKGTISGDWTQGDPIALDGTPEEEFLKTAYAFGTSGQNETVIISCRVDETVTLSVTREISLTEGRKPLPAGDIRTSSAIVSEEAIQEAAAKAVTFVSVSAGDFSLKENWENDLVSGKAVDITATADFGGNGEYVAGTISVIVSVTKVQEPAQITVTEQDGSGAHNIPATYYAGTVEFTVVPAEGSYVDSVTVNGEPVALIYENAAASGSFTVENDQAYTVAITYGTVEFTVAQDAEVALNLYVANYVDCSARLEGLKGILLTALLGDDAVEEEYDVFVYTTKLTPLGKDEYRSVDDLALYASQVKDTIKVKVVKKASADGKIPAVTVEDIPVKVVESRQDASITVDTVDEITVTDSFAPVTDTVANAVTTNGGKVTAVVESGEMPTPEFPSTRVTVKVTVAENKNALENTTTVEVSVKLAQYTITWNAGDGHFVAGDAEKAFITTQQYYGETVVAPEGDPVREQTVSHTYAFSGWENLTPDTTVSGDVSFTAQYQETIRKYAITWSAGDGAFADGSKEMVTEVSYGETPEAPVDPEAADKSFAGWTPEITSVTGEAAYTAQYTDDVIYKVTFVYSNGTTDKTIRVNATREETIPAEVDPEWEKHVFTGWNCSVDGVAFGATPDCEQQEIVFTAQWAPDSNENGVDDARETLTVTIIGEGQVAINGTTLVAEEDSDTVSCIFDSTDTADLTITATPVVADKFSRTYVVSIANVGDMVYGENYAASAQFAPANGLEITVTFAEAGFRLHEERILDYYPGMVGVTRQKVYEAIVNTPEWQNEAEITVEYLAREGGDTVYIDIDNLTFSSNSYLDAGIKSALKLAYSDGKIPVEQTETWVALGDTLKVEDYDDVQSYEELINEILQEKLKNFNFKDPVNELKSIIAGVQDSAKYYGAHEFGENASTTNDTTEEIRLTYGDAARKIQTRTDITLHDSRIATQILGSDLTLVYKDFKDTDLLDKVTVHTVDGDAVSGATVTLARESLGLEDKGVSETAYSVTFRYAGNETYKPSEATFQVTITKAAASMDIANVITTYGIPYTMNHNIICGNAYGDAVEIENSLIRFIVGLDVADVTLGESGITGTNTVVQLLLPENLKSGIGSITGALFEDGMKMSLSELLKALELIDADSLGILKQALEAISNIAGAGDITIQLGGKLPTNIGTYLYGAVSTTGNYETVLDAAYIIIKPDAQQVYLNWNYTDTNGIFTDALLQYVDLGASAFDDEAHEVHNADATAKVRNLFFGVNKGEDNKPALVLKLYEAGIDPATFDRELGNGGFTQMAFIVDFGNEMHYAIPIVRAFAIVPNTANVRITDEENTNFRRTYDCEKQELTVTVNSELPESGLTVRYVGVTTRGETYSSSVAPTDAGAYVVTAIYLAHDTDGKLTAIGADVKNLLVLPAATEVTVEDAIVTVGQTVELKDLIQVTAIGSPEMTILTTQLATDGSFSEIGKDAISGNVNVDFPQWVDDILAEKAPELYQGVTVGRLSEILNGKILNALEDLELDPELTRSLTEILDRLNESLNNLPVDANVTFHDTDATVFSQVGVYLVGAMVTDSNYRVSADYGLVLVKPDVQKIYLDWNYHDNNGIWTEELLRVVDLYASAYADPEFLYRDEEATKTITHTFLTVDANGKVQVTHDAGDLTYGAYLELAYIELDVDGTMTISNLIARPIVTVPNAVKVEFVDENGLVNHDRKFTYDGNPHAMDVRVTKNGIPVEVQDGELTVTYRGVTTAGEAYHSHNAPTEAGAYTVTAVYARYDGEKLIDSGAALGAMVIEPARVDFSVTGGIIPYDGENHGVTVSPETVQYTLISGTAHVDGTITEIGLEAVSANLNVDFPEWVDAILEEKYPDIYSNGVNAGTLIEKLNALNLSGTWVDTLVKLLEKVPSGMNVTFHDNIRFREPGVYVFAGFLTDFNYVPASDTALLVIQKKDSGLKFENTEVYYNGEAQSIQVTNPAETDYVTVIVDRENNIANILFEDDLTALKNLLEKSLGSSLPESIDVTALMTAIHNVIDNVAAWESLPADAKGALEHLRDVVSKLPQDGTVYIDGSWRPVNAGEYEFHGISLSPVYQTKYLNATLTIKPAEIVITVADQEIFFGEAEPEAEADVTVTHGKVSLDVTVTRDPGTDVGEYPYHVSYEKSSNYTVTENLGKLTIKPAEITITVADQEIFFGEAEPEAEADVTVTHGKVSLDVTVTRDPGTDVGEYPYHVSYEKSSNYTVTENLGKLTIKPKDTGDNDKPGLYPIHFDPNAETIQPGATVEIDGKPCVLDETCTAWVDHKDAKIAQTFTYHEGEDAHHTYPTHMYVWYLTFTDGDKAHYDAQPIPELTDFFQYHGTSIRVNFRSNGIRFMTSVDEKDAHALMDGSLIQTEVMSGYRMTQAGTLFKWYTGEGLTNDGKTASSLVYGVPGERDFRVFQNADGQNWFTGMLTNLGTDKETLERDLVSRPYAVLERNGESITIYGGTIQRSIYYVAKQNENWKPGTAYNDYIKAIIDAVEKQ